MIVRLPKCKVVTATYTDWPDAFPDINCLAVRIGEAINQYDLFNSMFVID